MTVGTVETVMAVATVVTISTVVTVIYTLFLVANFKTAALHCGVLHCTDALHLNETRCIALKVAAMHCHHRFSNLQTDANTNEIQLSKLFLNRFVWSIALIRKTS